jgi:hypothetical protein
MNFYASPDYLRVVGEVYFGGRDMSIEDVRVGGQVLRLLVIDHKEVITRVPFLDYHEPLGDAEAGAASRQFGYANSVVRRVIDFAEWQANTFDNLEVAPFIDWTKFPTYDDYRASIKKRPHVKEYWRRGRRFVDDFGEITFAMDDEQEDVFEFARRWKSEQLRATGQRDYFADSKNIAFFSLLRERGLLTSSTLRLRGRLLSVWLGFVHEGVWSGWIFTYDPEFRKYSVGHLLLNRMLEKSYELGHREFNFSIGGDEYKSRYATHVRVLGPIGRVPFSERMIALVKREAKKRSPKLIELARSLRNAL